jgi:glycosyltransferase involved in cell wall biosynthesis
MRVAVISKTFVAATAQRQLEWIARQPEIELTLITPPGWQSDDGRYLPFSKQFTQGYATRIVPVLFNGQYHFYSYRGLGRVLAQCQPEIIHIDEEPYNPAGAQAQRIADRMRVPSVFVAWQSLYRRYPPPFAQMEQYCYRHTSHIVAGNHAVADVLRRKGYTGPLSVFSVHGVDPEIYRPLKTYDGVPNDRFVIGYLGRFVLYKGLGVLLEALAILPRTCSLRLVGSGPDEALLRRMVEERGLRERVEFVPPVPTAQVPEALTRMDVLALPSLTQPNWMEQFGRVLIEAMACEVPVVGSTSGEIPSVIGDAGPVVPEGDAEALAAALRRLQDDPVERAALARKGRERVLSHFTQERVARALVDVYSAAAAYWAGGRKA